MPIYGEREDKYKTLSETDITSTEWKNLNPTSSILFLCTIKTYSLHDEYNKGLEINEYFPINSIWNRYSKR